MTENIKQFLETDALRTQGELVCLLTDEVFVGVEDDYADGQPFMSVAKMSIHSLIACSEAQDNANFIAAASRIAPEIRQLLSAFEQVCEALERYSLLPYGGNAHAVMALAAAAPYRKLMGGV